MKLRRLVVLGSSALLGAFVVRAVEMGEPRDVPPLFAEGEPQTAEEWTAVRRPALKTLLEDEVYGRRPVERPPHLAFAVVEENPAALGGKATMKRVRIEYGGAFGTNAFTCVAYIPNAARRVPAFLLIDIFGPGQVMEAGPEACVRLERIGYWPKDEIVSRGYAAVRFFFNEVTPDRNHGNTLGVFAAFTDVARQYRAGQATEWGALSAWGWGASRVLDWIETERSIDAAHVAVVGHSRGGKTALVAAAWDERFAMACSNDSGAGGAKLHHVDLPSSEHIAHSMGWARFWYAQRYVRWVNRDLETPFDQHMLVALVAPRLVCIGSATDDAHAGPYGEYLTARLASPAWRVFGLKGLVSDGFPPPDSPQQEGDISYHVRTGKHDLTRFDWKVYMDFADRHGWRTAGD